MNLVRLGLVNFRQHTESIIPFDMGTSAILGANGAGKTTLVEAISFALYGSKGVRGKLDEVRTRGKGKDEKETSVELSFGHDGRIYRIMRTLGSAEIFVGGEGQPLARGPREVTAFVNSVLGMNHEEFMATYFTEQKGLEFLSGQKGAAERERFILRMLGYDRFERLQELLRGERKDLRTELLAREAASGNREEIEKRLALERQEVELLTSKLREATSALNANENELEKIKKSFERVERVRADWLKERGVLTGLQGRYQERLKQLSKLQEWEQVESHRLLAELERIGIKDPNRLEVERENRENELRLLQEKESCHRAQLEKVEAARREAQLKNEAALISAERSYREATLHLKNITHMNTTAPCPTCGQELGASFHGHRESLELEVATAEKACLEARQMQEQSKIVPEEVTRLQQTLGDLSLAIEQHRVLMAKLQLLSAEFLRRKSQEGAQEEIRSEAEVLRNQVEECQQRINNLQFSEEDYLGLKGSYEARSGLANVSRLQRVKIEGELSSKQVLARRSEEELKLWEERNLVVTELKRKLLLFEEADLTLTEFRKNVNASVRPRLAELAGEFIAELTDGRYTTVEIGADFSPTVLEDGLPKPVISGGEEDILNLCVRLALSQMLAERSGHEISLLILDEVFGSLDQQRRENVLALLERLNVRFEQILIITHLEDVRDGVRHVLSVDYNESSGALAISIDQPDELAAIGI